MTREPQEPIKIVLERTELYPLRDNVARNATIVGRRIDDAGTASSEEETWTKYAPNEDRAKEFLAHLTQATGKVVGLDWHIKEGYKNWDEATVLEDEGPPKEPEPKTQEERIQETSDEVAKAAEAMRECMLESEKLFNERYPTLKTQETLGPEVQVAKLEYQQKIAVTLYRTVVPSAGYKR